MGTLQRIAGPVVRRALSADHPTRLGRSIMLLTIRGRRTGRELTLPVQYAREGDTVWVLPGHPERKTWWRNLRASAPVRMRLQGDDLTGTGITVSGVVEPDEAERGLRTYLRRFPTAARAVGIGRRAGDDTIRTAAERCTIVRIRIDAQARERGLASREGWNAKE